MQKLKEFYLKYKLVIALVVATLLLCAAIYVKWLWIVAAAVLFAFYLTFSITEMLCCTLYFEAFAGIGVFFITSILEMFLIICVKYIIDVKKKREPIYPVILIAIGVILVFWTVISFFTKMSVDGMFQGANIFFFLLVSYLIFIYYKKINLKNCFLFLMLGLIIASGLSLIAAVIPHFPYYTGISVSNGTLTLNRLQLFALNTNHISMACLFAISYFIYAIFNNKCNFWISISSIVIALVIGIMTKSKAFLLLFVLLFLIAFIYMIIRYKLKSLKVIIPTVILVGIAALIFHEKVYQILTRFTREFSQGSTLINNILTGRPEIWVAYLRKICSSVGRVLFGYGFCADIVTGNIAHNVIINIVYRMGIVGFISIIVVFGLYFNYATNRPKLKFGTIFMLFAFILLSFEEDVVSDRFMYFLFFAFIALIENVSFENNDENNKDIKETHKKNLSDATIEDIIDIKLIKKENKAKEKINR